MKALLVIALASIAAAKPQLPLYPYTYPLTYTVPVVTPVAVNTCKNSEGQLVPCASGAGSVYAHADAPGVPIVPGVLNTAGGVSPVLPTGEEAVKVEKRDAEADPSALWYGYYGRPWGLYRGYYGYYGHPFYGYGARSHQKVENAGASYDIHQLHKRDAEADPSAYWYGYYGHPYHWGYYGYPYYRSGGTSNQMVENAGASYEVKVNHKREAEADPSAYWYGYYGHPYHWGYYGYPYYRSGGTSNQMVENAGASYEVKVNHKREAEADADPSAWYYGYYGHGYHGYYGGYYGYYGHPYYGYYGGCRNNQGALVPCAGK